MKKIWILSVILLLTGCSKASGPVAVDQLPEADAFYILEDQTATPLLIPERDPSNTNLSEKVENKSISTFLITEEDLRKAPVLTDERLLIYRSGVFSGQVFDLYKLTDRGTSLGLKLKSSGNDYVLNDFGISLSEGSSAYDVLSNKRNTQIIAVGGERLSVNLVSESGTINGLTKDNLYRVSTLNGTKKEDLLIAADTRVFVVDNDSIFNPSESVLGENGFLNFKLPPLESGYYFIEDPQNQGNGGIFYKQ